MMTNRAIAVAASAGASAALRWPGDLRAWLSTVEAQGELKRVPNADLVHELGEITEINNAVHNPKALLFENIIGAETGRVLTCAASNPVTLGVTLGIEARDSASLTAQLRGGRLSQWIKEAVDKPFEWVDHGPIAANVKTGADIDLKRYPAPKWREADGGQYLGTGCVVITQDPITKTYNGGAYRSMVIDRDHVTVLMASATRHGRRHQMKYRSLGKPCPVVICVGQDPLMSILAGLEIPEGTFELDVAGAVLGQRCRMLRGQVTGLPIPADAEMVIEGWLTDDEATEGPFGEFLGYYAGGAHDAPLVKVEAIYHRDNPIVLGSLPGKPPNDLSYYFSVMRSALLHDQIEAAGVPNVTSVWADEVGGARLLITVAIKQQYFGHSRQAGLIASQCQAGVYMGRYVLVVDDDIDPRDLREVMWAVVSRTNPASDILTFDRSLGSPADPMKAGYEAGTMYSARAIVDACRPFKSLDTFPKVASSSKERLAATRKKWASLWGESVGGA